MTFGLYTLDDNGTPRLACSRPDDREGLLHWVKWFGRAEQDGRLQVARDKVGAAEVSTVFLGINTNVIPNGKPLVFETMMVRNGEGTVMGRRATLATARTLHAQVLETLTIANRRAGVANAR